MHTKSGYADNKSKNAPTITGAFCFAEENIIEKTQCIKPISSTHPYFLPTIIMDLPSIMAAARMWEPNASLAVSISCTSS